MAAQLFFDALIEPSLHRNTSPSHRLMPPFLPEQGVLAASMDDAESASKMSTHNMKQCFQAAALIVRTVDPP